MIQKHSSGLQRQISGLVNSLLLKHGELSGKEKHMDCKLSCMGRDSTRVFWCKIVVIPHLSAGATCAPPISFCIKPSPKGQGIRHHDVRLLCQIFTLLSIPLTHTAGEWKTFRLISLPFLQATPSYSGSSSWRWTGQGVREKLPQDNGLVYGTVQ